jgi:hypothetical protein
MGSTTCWNFRPYNTLMMSGFKSQIVKVVILLILLMIIDGKSMMTTVYLLTLDKSFATVWH